jgi:transposase
VAPPGKPKPSPTKKATAKKPRTPRRDTRHVDDVLVWVTYQLIGATQAATIHDVARTTVYRCINDVEADAAKLAEAKAKLKAQQEAREQRLMLVTDTATEALIGMIKQGKVRPSLLVEIVIPQGPPRAAGNGGHALQVPSFMTVPRMPAEAPSPPAEPQPNESEGT